MKDLGLYIHIPFCKEKCNYCDFYSLPKCADSLILEYSDAIASHIERESVELKDYEITTIFIGGGTPSHIDEGSLGRIIKAVKKHLRVSENAEITIEANPGTLTREKLQSYLENGINRLSIGLQSLCDKELAILGRIHSVKDFFDSYNLAREVGFKNISVDIMYGLPSQNTEVLLETLRQVCMISPEHISAYCLKIEENTPFYKIKDKLTIPNDEEEHQMYIAICNYLAKNGYTQYEISNFAREGFESRHNLKYWLFEEYIGFGPAAHSFINGKRYFYESDIRKYIKSLKDENKAPQKLYDEETEILQNSREEYVMLRMRLGCGVDLLEYSQKFGSDFEKDFPKIKDYYGEYVKKEDDSVHFTPDGFFVSNHILSKVLL